MNILQKIHTMDIYLLDQLMKGKFNLENKILDAGCGNGRNLTYFIENGYSATGLDKNEEELQELRKKYPNHNFIHSKIANLPFKNDSFDRVICIAVLHFAENKTHFIELFAELLRVLQPKGLLFIRMASNIGIENNIKYLGNGVYKIPDGTTRFLLTRELLEELFQKFSIKKIEPLKTVNVDDKRSMTTLVIEKV